MPSVNFYLPDNENGSPVVKLTHNYKRVRVSQYVPFYVDTSKCKTKGQLIVDTKDLELKAIMLDTKKLLEVTLYNKLLDTLNRVPTIEELRDEFLYFKGFKTRPTDFDVRPDNLMFFEVWDLYLSQSEGKVVSSTLKFRSNLGELLKDFCNDTNVVITFKGVNYSFFSALQEYCRQEIHYSDNTIGKLFNGVKQFMNWSYKKGYTVHQGHKDPDIKIVSVASDIVVYTPSELKNIINIDLSGTDYEEIRDLILVGCYTGFRVGDLLSVDSTNIHLNDLVPELSYITIVPSKTKNKTITIPIGKHLLQIINKYNGFPKITSKGLKIDSKRLRDGMKVVSDLAGINGLEEKRILKNGEYESISIDRSQLFTPHRMRATFITMMLRAGIPSEQVMSMSGHSSYKSFQRYVKFTSEDNVLAVCKTFDSLSEAI